MITVPPQLRESTPDKEAIRAEIQRCAYKSRMELGQLNTLTKRFIYNNGMEIVYRYCFGKEDVWVTLPVVEVKQLEVAAEETLHGFAVHPRTSLYPTGANFSKTLPDGSYEKLPTVITTERPDGSTYDTPITTMFPLYDDDKGTMAIVGEETEWESEVADPDNYGIHAWTSEDETVTWRGWPCRTIGCGRETYVEGVTQGDVQTSFNTFYTPLFGNIYVDGEAIPVPGKVRGAGVSSVGKVFISTVNYTQYDFVGFGSNEVNPDGLDWLYDNPDEQITDDNKAGKVGNYYDELYVEVTAGVPYTVNGRVRYATSVVANQDGTSVDGWLRIGHRISPITNLSVWFSADGKSTNEDGGSWSWTFAATPNADKEVSQGTFTSRFTERTDTAVHEYTVYGAPNPWKVVANTSWQTMYMLTKHGIVSYFRDDKTIGIGVSHEDADEYGKVDVYHISRPDPTGYYIEHSFVIDSDGAHIYTFTATQFKAGPYKWEGAEPLEGSNGDMVATLTLPQKCVAGGTIPALITVSVIDNCGFTASYTFSEPLQFGYATLMSDIACVNPITTGGVPANSGYVTVQTDDGYILYFVGFFTSWGGTPTWTCRSDSTWGGEIISSNADIIIVAYRKQTFKIQC